MTARAGLGCAKGEGAVGGSNFLGLQKIVEDDVEDPAAGLGDGTVNTR